MVVDMPAPSNARFVHRVRAWCRRRLPSRTAWAWLLAAGLLLAMSQVLWLWYSWPVRQVLDVELTTGPSP